LEGRKEGRNGEEGRNKGGGREDGLSGCRWKIRKVGRSVFPKGRAALISQKALLCL
jgi:hypothetical protein